MTTELSKAFVLSQLHRLYREDPWFCEMIDSGAVKLDDIAQTIMDIYNSNWFDTLPEDYIERYEDALGIKRDPTKTISDRRRAIEARWKGDANLTVQVLQTVVDEFEPGLVVSFEYDSKSLTYDIFVTGDDWRDDSEKPHILAALDEVKPAHLEVRFRGFAKWLYSERCEAHHGGILRFAYADAPEL